MTISSTRKISSNSSTPSKIGKRFSTTNNYSQYIENIDTTNNVLIKDENNEERRNHESPLPEEDEINNYSSSKPNIINGIEAIAATISPEEQGNNHAQISKVNIYTNNQSIIHDKDVERTGHSYLKHFYEKNKHIIDVDELA